MIDKFYNPEIEKYQYFKWTEINQSGYENNLISRTETSELIKFLSEVLR